MRCRRCGLEVDDDKAFCPGCGAAMKVTADIDYIQAEIANKVDRYCNDDDAEEQEPAEKEMSLDIPDLDSIISSGETENITKAVEDITEEAEPENQSEEDDETDEEDEPEKKKKEKRPKRQPKVKTKKEKKKKIKDTEDVDDLAATKNIYGTDSIFDEEMDIPDFDEDEEEEAEEKPVRPARRGNVNAARRNDTRQRPARSGHQERPRNERPRQTRRPEPQDKGENNQTAAKIFTVLIIFIIIAAAVIGIMVIMGYFGDKSGGNQTAQVNSTLTTNISAGTTYTDPVEVTINNAVEGNVFYTLDGSEPSLNSKIYSGPFTITATDVPATYPNVTLRAVAYSSDSEKSGELTVSFQLEYDENAIPETEEAAEAVTTEVAAPVISPESGDYEESAEIIVTAEDGAKVYYTLNGSTPTTESKPYTGPVTMAPGSSTFSAIAVKDGVVSDVASCDYNLTVWYNIGSDYALTLVIDSLYWNGEILDYDLNTEDGYADIYHVGIYEIDGYTYYIVEVDFYTSDGVLVNTEYKGVGVNYGGISNATQSGNSFTVDE